MVEEKNFQIMMFGKQVLMPYLLNRRFSKIDYVIISHFDFDHIGGLLYVMDKMKVKNVIISKQPEESVNYDDFIKIIKNKKINLIIVNAGDRLKISNEVYFDILWPNSDEFISENALNNNSIVCKLNYKSFSMLFTGDIEEIAEKRILEKYKNNLGFLKADILKIAHHGSKSSTTQEFLDAVRPKKALIGVGKNNKFGHPSNIVIERLENSRNPNLSYR